MTDWAALTQRTLAGLETCDPIYRPTNFWGPGVRRLLDDLETSGLDGFKSWSQAATWFYPTYGNGFTKTSIERTLEAAQAANPDVQPAWFETALTGAYQARRDFDAVRLAWDQAGWPFDLEAMGESQVGRPPQFFRLLEADRTIGWTRPYLNYLLCLAALSRHVDGPPSSFLEIGGGYGVLGEIVMSRDPGARYVNLDLPPLTTVSSFYLQTLFPERVTVYDAAVAEAGLIEFAGSASLPNWRIGDVTGPFDVFINSFSFQEMEPDVVERYISDVAALGVDWVVSLNSKAGKRRATEADDVGVIEPVTSDRIAERFEAHGYDLVARHGDPLIQSVGELLVLRRKGLRSRPASPLAPRPEVPAIDHRATTSVPGASAKPKPTSRRRLTIATRDHLPAPLLGALRRMRRPGR